MSMRQKFGRGLFAKLLIVMVPLFLVLSVPGISIVVWQELRQERDSLGARLGVKAASITSLYDRHNGLENPKLAKDFLLPLTSDPAFLCAEVRPSGGGNAIAKMPSHFGCDGQNSPLRLAVPVGNNGEAELLIQFSDAEIIKAEAKSQGLTQLIVGISFVFMMLAAAISFRLVVGKPLKLLLESIRKSTETGLKSPIDYRKNDELGVVIGAFNEMIARDAEREKALEKTNSALRASEQELKALNEDLERRVQERTAEVLEKESQIQKGERMAALGKLTATVSHELRNPLGALRTSLFLIENKTKDQGLGLERAMGRADRSISRCDSIITEMLDFARTTEVDAEMGVVDEWLEELIGEQEVAEGIEVSWKAGAPGVEAPFDGDRLRRAVINIFDNGCQAMALAGEDEKRMTVESRVRDGRFEIVLTDTGPGMDEETLSKIFEPLFSTKSLGTGLGMPTVRQVMELHRGGIEVESEPGVGTTVTLWLPLEKALGEEAA